MKFPAEPFKTALITASEIARLFGVSRVTAYRWLDGHPVSPMLRSVVTRTAAQVTAATEAGRLPVAVSPPVTPERKLAALVEAIGSNAG